MRAIYETKGRAREYCELAYNLYTGCEHGCLYCYAPATLHKTPEEFRSIQHISKSFPAYLEHDAWRMQKSGDKRPVLLCFTCDPYQPGDNLLKLARQAIQILHMYDVPVMILTKGGDRAKRDFDLLGPRDWFGVTLTFTPERINESFKWEPFAAAPHERISSLRMAYGIGINTWVSLEPVIDPEQSLKLIERTAGFVDHFKVGKWNHDKGAEAIDWRKFAHDAKRTLDGLGCSYYIKKDLERYL